MSSLKATTNQLKKSQIPQKQQAKKSTYDQLVSASIYTDTPVLPRNVLKSEA